MNHNDDNTPRDEQNEFLDIGIPFEDEDNANASDLTEDIEFHETTEYTEAIEEADSNGTRDDFSPDADQQMFTELGVMRKQIDRLFSEFESKLKYDEHKNKIIDGLHQELQVFRQGIIKKHLLSMITDIIKIIDDIRKFKTHWEEQSPTEQTNPFLEFMDQISSDLEDLFSWQGVVAYTCENDTLDTTRQRVIKKIETDAPDKNKLVARSLRPGYEWDGKVIRPEMVSVYTYNDTGQTKDVTS